MSRQCIECDSELGVYSLIFWYVCTQYTVPAYLYGPSTPPVSAALDMPHGAYLLPTTQGVNAEELNWTLKGKGTGRPFD
jgi:hypothetical protein